MDYNGIKFSSKKELNRYKELVLLEKSGAIRDLVCQPRYTLQESFTLNNVNYRKIEYIADFEYYDMSLLMRVVEDVKSPFTKKLPVYGIKKKLFLRKYGMFIMFIDDI